MPKNKQNDVDSSNPSHREGSALMELTSLQFAGPIARLLSYYIHEFGIPGEHNTIQTQTLWLQGVLMLARFFSSGDSLTQIEIESIIYWLYTESGWGDEVTNLRSFFGRWSDIVRGYEEACSKLPQPYHEMEVPPVVEFLKKEEARYKPAYKVVQTNGHEWSEGMLGTFCLKCGWSMQLDILLPRPCNGN